MFGAQYPGQLPPGGFYVSGFYDPELVATMQSHYSATIQNHFSADVQNHFIGTLNDRHYTATIGK